MRDIEHLAAVAAGHGEAVGEYAAPDPAGRP